MPSDQQLTAAQRAAAIERIAENLALRSGAGCGKTFVLARRYVELLRRSADADRAIGRLVALTFTEKAALEMSARVRRMLREFAAGAAGEDRRRLLAWLDELPGARISTIHGFCAAVLRSHAVEAGIDPNFAVCADEFLVAQMIADAAEQAALQAVEDQRPDAAELLANVAFEEVVRLVEQLMEARTAWDLGAYADPAATLRRWHGLLEARRAEEFARLAADQDVRRQLKELEAFACSDPADRLLAFRQEQIEIIRGILGDPSGATAETFARLNHSPGNIGGAKAWGKEEVKELRAGLRELIRRIEGYAVFAQPLGEPDRRAAEALAALTGLARQAVALYAAEKRRRGLLDFTDLLDRADRLLAASPAARDALAGGIEQLLMDEGQDTDGFQLRMLARLIGGGTPEAAPPEGKLFLVGDAMQSIYRFRGAQVEEFRGTCRRLGPRRQESLHVSFRTHQAGTAFVNHLFAPMMGDGYEPVQACRTELPPGPSVEVLLATGPDGQPPADAASASRAQAAATAERIRRMLDARERIVRDDRAGQWRAVRPGDVAVLFARMTNSLAYERELQLRDVPYYVVGGTGFFRQQEVFDVLNALAAVDNPRDDIALFGALRSSLFGLDDNTLMHVAEACPTPYIASLGRADLSGRLPPDQAEALNVGVDLIGRLHRVKDAVGIDVLLDRLLEATGYEATLLAQFQGRRMVSNVRRLADRARAAAGEHAALADFIARMRQQAAGETRYEQAAVAGEHEDVVRLLTIHKAKGLEFPVVFVPDLNAGRRGPAGRCLIRSDWGVTLNYLVAADEGEDRDDEQAQPVSFRIARTLEDRDGLDEDVRRLYVAATRHQDHLVFVGADWRTKDGRLRDADSYLARMDELLGLSAALEAGRQEVPYDNGRFAAVVRRIAPAAAEPTGGRPPVGQRLLAAATSGPDLAGAMRKAGARAGLPPLVGPLPADAARVEIAVTALNDFERCPMLYRWRHELRVPRSLEAPPSRARATGARGHDVSLDAATVGTLYHRCMELLDFAAPQPAEALLRQAAAEMDMDETPAIAPLRAELEQILRRLRRHELWAELRDATQAFRELDFVWDCPPAVLRGQIDLLYQDRRGTWHVADYKSDLVAGEDDLRGHAAGYEMQVLLYAAAAARRLGTPPAGVMLYFLRPARAVPFDVAGRAIAQAEQRAAQLARQLVESRRLGRFERRFGEACSVCPYRALCPPQAPAAPPGRT